MGQDFVRGIALSGALYAALMVATALSLLT